ncbi:hypothetical protein G4177_16230 [Corallococcus sp. ZKHCc1 1396]|uniref:Uncharacterized protein n=1 Tax=Corallococcus soli TaxID=2710757 RepID=A0ABR9PP75_9BACT|nr:hypothetical protein [Corallococcus soli]MBE4749713.1 hypothetical protein [Corallococcus soli]
MGTIHEPLEDGALASLPDGTRVTVVRCVPAKQLRLRLEREEWGRARTVQLRLIPSVHGITVALHAEGLPDAGVREELLARWTHALESWEAFSGRHVAVSRSGPPTRDPAGGKEAQETPSLEKGLAERGAADLKAAGPAGGARGVKQSAARGAKKSVSAKPPSGVRKGVKKGVAAKSRGGVKKGVAAKPLGGVKKGVKKSAEAKPRGGVKKSVSAKPRGGVKKSVAAKRAGGARKAPGRKTAAAKKTRTRK